ncbi:hypothetical protein Aperf_G00000103775 [Anoplocephala perfoliata]
MSITSKASDPRYKIYMSQEVEGGGIPVCYLVVQKAVEADSGVFTCKSSHPDSNIYEVSAKVLVHDKTMRLALFLQNGTDLRENSTVKAVCSARGIRRPPNLRFQFGGEPVKASLPTREVESNGEYNVTVNAVIPLDWRSHLRLLTCHADIGDFTNVKQTFLVIHLRQEPGKKNRMPFPDHFLPWVNLLGAFDDNDKLNDFLGINEETPNSLADETESAIITSYSAPFSISPNSPNPSVPGEFILYVDESSDIVVITCEVSMPSKGHSVHLLCPLVPETRLCFENCRRVCALPDCRDKPKLFAVECVEDVFVRDMYNIWKFRYIIDRHDTAVEGTWGCFHAGKSTDTINVTAVLATTTEPILRLTPANPMITSDVHLNSRKPSLRRNSSWINKTQSKSGQNKGLSSLFDASSLGQKDIKNHDLDKTVIIILAVFLMISIAVNIVYISISSCRKKEKTTGAGLKDNLSSTMISTQTTGRSEVTQVGREPPWNDLSHPSYAIQPPIFFHGNQGGPCNVNRSTTSAKNDKRTSLYVLNPDPIKPSASQQSWSYLIGQTKTCPPTPRIYKTIILGPMGTHNFQHRPSQTPLHSSAALMTSLTRNSGQLILSSNDKPESPSPCSSASTENNTFI